MMCIQPPAPFSLAELDADSLPPQQPYSKEELQAYLAQCRRKCRATIMTLTDDTAQRRCQFRWGELSYLELLLYNMRHVQEHAAQLNLLRGQKLKGTPGWVIEAGNERPACWPRLSKRIGAALEDAEVVAPPLHRLGVGHDDIVIAADADRLHVKQLPPFGTQAVQLGNQRVG